MTVGAGKYDELCTYVRVQAQAAGAIIIVIDGDKGEGFCCQASPEVTAKLPKILRHLADTMQADLDNDLAELRKQAQHP